MNKEEFINELKKINIELTKQQLTLLEEYYIILKEENEKYNLTRIIEQNEVYLKHFYDSLTINKIIDIYSQNICDLGSGAGFPGLVLAICFPKTKITLIESNGKKCYFLNFLQDIKIATRQNSTQNDKLKNLKKNYCTRVKIMISSRWSIYIYNVYRNKYD